MYPYSLLPCLTRWVQERLQKDMGGECRKAITAAKSWGRYVCVDKECGWEKEQEICTILNIFPPLPLPAVSPWRQLLRKEMFTHVSACYVFPVQWISHSYTHTHTLCSFLVYRHLPHNPILCNSILPGILTILSPDKQWKTAIKMDGGESCGQWYSRDLSSMFTQLVYWYL